MGFFQKLFGQGNRPDQLDRDVAKAAGQTAHFEYRYTKAKNGIAKELLAKLATDHAHELVKGGHGKPAKIWAQFAANLTGESPLDHMASLSPNKQKAYAEHILAMEDFPLAIKAYERLFEMLPQDTEIARTLSALHLHMGDADRAKHTLNDFFKRNPVTSIPASAMATELADPKTLLVLYGHSGSRFKIDRGPGGGYSTYRSGGHFMLRHLLDAPNYNRHKFTVSDGNIDQLSKVESYDLILNSVADADREYGSLKAMEAYFEQDPPTVPIINHPTKVLATTRDGNYERLNALDGFVFPKTQRFLTASDTPDALAKAIEARFTYPLIVRETGTHTAVSTELVDTHEALTAYLKQTKADSVYAIQFTENASPEGHYTKLRFFSIDKQFYPVVYHTDQVWNVHGGNRKTFMASQPWMLERERQFLMDPPAIIGADIYDRLQQLPDMIGLDFFGFDFSVLPDGNILIFELNPAMRHSFKHGKKFPYMMPHLQNISSAFKDMIRKRIADAR